MECVEEGALESATNLRDADLSEAHLIRAGLRAANLNRADLSKAVFSQAHLNGTVFADNDLSTVIGLDTVQYFGPSMIGTDTLFFPD